MNLIGPIVALVACVVLCLSAYLTVLYVETQKLRPHARVLSFELFENRIMPRLRCDAEQGRRRYIMVRQIALGALAIDFTLMALERSSAAAALLEAGVLTIASVLIFAHVLPSVLLTRTEGRWALALTPLFRALGWSVAPLVLLAGFADSVVELGGEEPEENSNGTAGDITALLDAGQEEGLIGEDDRKLIRSVVEFGDKTVREVMTPRPQMVTISRDASVEELRRLQIEEEYSRIPVFAENIDDMVGFVHSRDVLEIGEDDRERKKVIEMLRPIALVPESKEISALMRELQENNAQMAIVVDEYGQTAGLATMEDLMEEIVGEIRDESEPGHDVTLYPDGSFVASGNLDLDRLEELVGYRPDDAIESTTIGGLVCEELGQVPLPGAKISVEGVEIEVLSADERRVRSVRARREPAAKQTAPRSDEEGVV